MRISATLVLILVMFTLQTAAQDGVISVKQFGAWGLGGDDTRAIQTAIAAAASSPYHSPLYFPPGSYGTSQSLAMPNSVSIVKGAGHNASRIFALGTTAFPLLSFEAGSEGIQVQDLYLDCSHTASTALLVGISANAYIANNILARCTDAALVMDAVQNAIVMGNDLRESRIAAKIVNGTSNSVFLRNEHELTSEVVMWVGKDSSYPSYSAGVFDNIPTQNTFGPGNIYADGGTYTSAVVVQDGSTNLWTSNNLTAGSGPLIIFGPNTAGNRFADNKIQMGSSDFPVVTNQGYMNGFRGDFIQVRAAPNQSCTNPIQNTSVLILDRVSVNDDCFFTSMKNSVSASTFVTPLLPATPYMPSYK